MIYQIQFDWKRLCLSIPIFIYSSFLILVLLYPLLSLMIVNTNNYSGGYDKYQWLLEQQRNNLNSGSYDREPKLYQYVTNEISILDAIVKAQSQGDSEEQFNSMLDYEKLLLELSGTSYYHYYDAQYIRYNIFLIQEHINAREYCIYDQITDMPMLNYLASILTYYPAPVLFIPTVLASTEVFTSAKKSKSKVLDKVIPLSEMKLSIAHLISSLSFSCFLTCICFLPCLGVAFTLNGLGSIGYPVVNMLNNKLSAMTLCSYLGCFFALSLSVCVFIGSLSGLMTRLFSNKWVTIILLVTILCIPMLVMYYRNPLIIPVIHRIPISYIYIVMIIGTASPEINLLQYQYSDLFRNADLTTIHGVCALIASSIVLIVFSVILASARKIARII